MKTAEEKIKQFCGNIQERISACRSREAALLLKKRMCSELRENCMSEMINNSLSYEVERIIENVFGEDSGRNKHKEK